MFNRCSGVLMNISSLPSPFSVGVFGKEAQEFADFIKSMGFSKWQVLPLGPIDRENSPYTADSAFAGNVLFIDPRGLAEDGLVTGDEVKSCEYSGSVWVADYDFARERHVALLKTAFSRITPEMSEKLDAFCAKNAWLCDYALFLAIKDAKDGAPWWEWGELSNFKVAKKHEKEFDTRFYKFCQYTFFTQWEKLKAYANEKGVEIIGDMPIYVAPDSCDVWANREQFCLDEKGLAPAKVAGCPPDYFSEDGQYWGNPIYDWAKMEKDGYKWWIKRIEAALKLYDTVRIDHFRGMASYWAIPAGAKSAKEGCWEKGPAEKLFNAIKKAIPSPSIIAEDLGTFGEDVVKLLEYTNFPGMRVIQFAFSDEGDKNCTHLPHNYPKNCLAYVGTHDNNTLLGWLWESSEYQRRFALDYCGFKGDNWGEGGRYAPACHAIIETVWKSPADVAIIATQDLLGFGADARMNVPGVPDKNWCFRASKEALDDVDRDYFKRINRVFGRD